MADNLDAFAPDVDLNAEPEAETPEPVVEQEVQQEVKEEPKVEEPKVEEQRPPKLVPLEALHESRAKEREWRQKAEAIEKDSQERFQKLEQRLEKLMNPPPPVPDFATDPAGHLQHQVAETKAELAAVRQNSEESRKAQEIQVFEQQIATSTQQAEQVFMKDHPDYLAAVQHLQTIADKNMEMMGVEDPAQRQAQIRKDALSMSLKALQMGKSPAEVAYNLAINYGYKSGVTNQVSDAAKKIQSIQEGQKTQTIPSGGKVATTLTLAALETMDDDDFNKMVDDPNLWNKMIRQMA